MDLLIGQLARVFGHVRVPGMGDEFVEQAIARPTGDDRRSAHAAMDQLFAVAEIELRFHRFAAMAFQTTPLQHWPYLLLEEVEAASHLGRMVGRDWLRC